MGTPTAQSATRSLQIHFNVHKKTEFGKAVYVVGSVRQLGEWNVKFSLKLSWNRNHFWSGAQQICTDGVATDIEFKYVVGNWDHPEAGVLEWEAGEANRKIELSSAKQHVVCQNSWNMEKIQLNLFMPVEKNVWNYSVIGNCKQLGRWKKPIRLQERPIDQEMKECLWGKVENVDKIRRFSTIIEIYRGKPQIHYYYVRNDSEVVIERHPGRKLEIGHYCNSHPRCLKIGHQAGNTELYETCDFEELNYSRVTENILLGAYVKSADDFKLLQKERVTSILSIQTDQDLASHRLTLNYLSELCDEHELQLFTYSIQDMDKKDFLSKWAGAVILLRKLLRLGNKVYVHCSAGVYRSPQIVALYLMLVNHISPAEAVKFVKKRHPFARPNEELIRNAFEMVTKSQPSREPVTHI